MPFGQFIFIVHPKIIPASRSVVNNYFFLRYPLAILTGSRYISSMDTLGKRIKQRRNDLKMDRKDLAELVGMSYGALADIENGKANTTKYLSGLARHLRCNIDWLDTGEGPVDLQESRHGSPDPSILRDVIELMLTSIERSNRPIETIADADLICFTYDLLLRERSLGVKALPSKGVDNVVAFRRINAKMARR